MPASSFRSRRAAIAAWLVILAIVYGGSAVHALTSSARSTPMKSSRAVIAPAARVKLVERPPLGIVRRQQARYDFWR
jgi:hypothetical protein